MSSEWKEVKLGDIAQYSKCRINNDELTLDNYISTENMIPEKCGVTIASSLPSGNAIKYKRGQTLVSNIRPYFKKIWYATKEGGCSSDVLVFNISDEIDSKYFYYLLSEDKFFDYVMAGSKGTKMPRGDKQQIMMYPLLLPETSEQKVIADTLSCLDDKIELNNRINKTLEEMAQAIFKSWFVDFEPFQDGEFEDNELGRRPKGWQVGRLEDVLVDIEAGNRPKGGVGNLDAGIPSIGAENIIGLGKYDFSKEKYVSKEYYESMNKGVVKNWDVLLYKDGAQLGRKTMFAQNFPHKKCCVNSHVFILRCNDLITQPYLYFWLDQDSMTQNIINLNTNSAQPGINQPAVKQLKILIPDKDTVHRFQDIIEKLMSELFENCKENQILSTIRDTLLPKLMSGEIRVPLEG